MCTTIGREYVRKILLLVAFLGAAACSRESQDSSRLQSSAGTPDAKPAETQSIDSQLKRYIGQESFLSIGQRFYPELAAGKAPEADGAAPPDAGGRVIQEADLFKVGKAGSKILYTLNPYRGLQVIDFSQGEEAPRLLGRSDVSGNEQIEMYFDEAHMQILVTERRYDPYSGAQGRVVVFSVQDPTRPMEVQSIELPGDVADSRLVGDVLYVASSRWAYYPNPGGEGWISSFRLNQGGLAQVASYPLLLPVQSQQSLNIIESREGDRIQYYLISVLAENRFSWRERQSTVEVVDISDVSGQIQPLLMVSTKGELRERSGTHIRKGALITVSNSWSNNAQGTPIRRVSVESFALPSKDAKTVDPAEAEFRRVWFEREMKKRPADVSAEDFADQLSRDPEFGLKGIFVKREDGRLSKIFADQVITVGDSTGLHADLQDVRFINDKLYVFWVPANQVDPLDVFDISQPTEKLEYLGRTLFDGWMERAIPLAYKGEDYILGLGWIVPAVGQNPQRSPQAMIFKLPKQAGEKVQTLAQLTLDTPNLWSYFNDQDKSIVVRTNEDGTGNIIFPASTWGAQYLSGGKMLGYDLNATNGNLLQEGGFLAADAAWLRRVFANPELDRMHALSDRALSTFNLDTHGLGKAGQIFQAVSVLELARDIRAYAHAQIAGQTYGVQVVELYTSGDGEATTQVRVVNEKEGDAELSAILQKTTVPGRYLTHLLNQDGDLLILTSLTRRSETEEWTNVQQLHRLRFAEQGNVLSEIASDTVEWTAAAPSWIGFSKMAIYAPWSPAKLVEINRGQVLVASANKLVSVSTGSALQLKEHQDALACLPADAEGQTIHVLGQDVFASYAVPHTALEEAFKNMHVVREFLVPFDKGSLSARCDAAVNIPGRPIRVGNGQLITEENRFLGLEESGYDLPPMPVDHKADGVSVWRPEVYSWAQTARVLHALRWNQKAASLKDIYSLEDAQGNLFESGQDLVHLEQDQEWSPRLIVRLSLGADDLFVRTSLVVPQQKSQDVQLIAVLPEAAKDQSPLFLLRSGREGVLYADQDHVLRPTPVIVIQASGQASKAQSSFPVLDWYSGEDNNRSRIVFNKATGQINLAQGLWGVQQLKIVESSL